MIFCFHLLLVQTPRHTHLKDSRRFTKLPIQKSSQCLLHLIQQSNTHNLQTWLDFSRVMGMCFSDFTKLGLEFKMLTKAILFEFEIQISPQRHLDMLSY